MVQKPPFLIQSSASDASTLPHVAELRCLPLGLLVEPCIRIGRRGVRVVAARLTVEVTRAVAPRTGWLAAAVLGPEALHRRPCLDQRAIHREVLAREPPLDLRASQDRAEEAMRYVALQQPVAVLGEYRHVPNRRLDRQADEPTEEDVVGQLLHQLPLRADREERLKQQGPQQLLGRDRGPSGQRVELIEVGRQTRQRRVHQQADLAQWMIRRHQRLRVHVAAQVTSLMIPPAHPPASPCLLWSQEIKSMPDFTRGFPQPATLTVSLFSSY